MNENNKKKKKRNTNEWRIMENNVVLCIYFRNSAIAHSMCKFGDFVLSTVSLPKIMSQKLGEFSPSQCVEYTRRIHLH